MEHGVSKQRERLSRTRFGASTISTIAGLNPWGWAGDVWQQYVDPKPRDDGDTFHTQRGKRLEIALLEWAADEVGLPIRHNAETIPSDRYERCMATPDGLMPDADAVAEIKCPSPHMAYEWRGPNDTMIVPDRYVAQCQWQMLAVGAQRALIAFHAGWDLQIKWIERDDRLIEILIERAEWMWDLIERKVPPPVDGSRACSEWIAKRSGQSELPMLHAERDFADPDIVEDDLDRLFRLKAELLDLEGDFRKAQNEIKARIGEHCGIAHPTIGTVTWKNNKPSESTQWKELAQHLLSKIDDRAKVEGLITEFTKSRPGARVFRLTPRK